MERNKIAIGAALAAFGLMAAPAGANAAEPLPVLSSCQVEALDADSVRVTGTVDPNGVATSVRVRYGLLDLLNLGSPEAGVGSSLVATPVTIQLDDLVPGAGYSCQLEALVAGVPVAFGSTSTFLANGEGSGGSDGSGGSNGSNGFNGSGGTGATPAVNPVTGQVVPAGTPGSVKCTLAGTAGADRLKGTKRSDVICGLGGADRISGRAGNDILIGSAGRDRMKGNKGKDRLLGNSGRDRLNGGVGADRLDGSGGEDRLFGWKGRDRMSGGAGNDRLIAERDQRGGDRLRGGRGRDRASTNRGDRVRSVERKATARS